MTAIPEVIQGGMGAGVSGWELARATSTRGLLGVVAGTALDLILARRLQRGDPGGPMRRALAAYPDPSAAGRILARYFVEGGKPAGAPFRAKPLVHHRQDLSLQELLAASAFAEVFLAKEGHEGLVGINFLEKIQTPLLPALYGAMLAGVDAVIVGAGIPREIPGILERLSRSEAVETSLHGGEAGQVLSFRPRALLPDPPRILKPLFLPVVASLTLAGVMVKKTSGQVDGLILEGPTAGGHNAPPRGPLQLNAAGEPVYGERDVIDLERIRELGVPFWLAGSYGSPERLAEARASGAAGIQVGTLFAFCRESGLREDLKLDVIRRVREGRARVYTDPLASPTGFPFKVLNLGGRERPRRPCDLGYLREAYATQDGSVGWRCAAEDLDSYLAKGGSSAEAKGRVCLCNGLMANLGLGQVLEDGSEEPPLLTCGDDLSGILKVLGPGRDSYGAADVIGYLTGGRAQTPGC